MGSSKLPPGLRVTVDEEGSRIKVCLVAFLHAAIFISMLQDCFRFGCGWRDVDVEFEGQSNGEGAGGDGGGDE